MFFKMTLLLNRHVRFVSWILTMCEETTMRALWLLLGVAFLVGSGLGSRPPYGRDTFHCKCSLLIKK